ncbi:MAG: cadmium-translocating P-type ATPase [Armatimonadetes bacterium]|nr:cadmium-translocating P-type ATPase [Armatimonadota bacterium]
MSSAAEQSPTQTCEWQVAGLDCPNCVAMLEKACRAVPGVVQVQAHLTSGRLTATVGQQFDPTALEAAARRAGHPLSAVSQAPPPVRADRLLVVSSIALVVGFALQLAGQPATPAYAVAALLGTTRLVPLALAALRMRTITIDALMVLALFGAMGLGDWFDAALLAVLFAVAEAVEAASLSRTGHAVQSLLALAPRMARVECGDRALETPVEAVQPGQIVRVRPGDAIPLDGLVLDGAAGVDESAMTGESVPVAKSPGDRVYAGTMALDGALRVQVTQVAGDSTLARIVALVEQAQDTASPTQRVVDRFAAWYTPLIIALVAAVWILGPIFGLAFRDAFLRGTVLLVIGCPCAIVIATPVAIYSGLTAAARRGILVRGGEVLERAAGLKVVALDKTGTLTMGQPRLERMVCLDGLAEDRALAIAAALEADSSHPLAAAISRAAHERGLAVSPAGEHQAVPGRGVMGSVDGERFILGGRSLLAELGVDPALALPVCDAFEHDGLTPVILADGQPLAVLGLADRLRPEAAEMVAALTASGLARPVMLTGDRRRPAEAVARLVGIEDVRAELLPADKQAELARLRRIGPTAMVGDGINDAPALASADVGVALGAVSSAIAQETADVSLLGADLRGVARLVALARRVRRTIGWNIAIAIGIRLVLVPLAVMGWADLWLAILGDVGGSLAVTANSLRILRADI